MGSTSLLSRSHLSVAASSKLAFVNNGQKAPLLARPGKAGIQNVGSSNLKHSAVNSGIRQLDMRTKALTESSQLPLDSVAPSFQASNIFTHGLRSFLHT